MIPANCFYYGTDGKKIFETLRFGNCYADFLRQMAVMEIRGCYNEFLQAGCYDTFDGFLSMFKNDIFDAQTFKPLEIGGCYIGIRSLRD